MHSNVVCSDECVGVGIGSDGLRSEKGASEDRAWLTHAAKAAVSNFQFLGVRRRGGDMRAASSCSECCSCATLACRLSATCTFCHVHVPGMGGKSRGGVLDEFRSKCASLDISPGHCA